LFIIIVIVILNAGYKRRQRVEQIVPERKQFSKISFEGKSDESLRGRKRLKKKKGIVRRKRTNLFGEMERNGKEDSSRRRPFSEAIAPRNSGTTKNTEKEESFEGNGRIIFEARQFLKISFEGKSDESLRGRKRRSFSENRSRNRTGQPTEAIEDRSRKRKYGARKKKIVLEDIVQRKQTDYFRGNTG